MATIQSELQDYGLASLWNPSDPQLPLYTQLANSYKKQNMNATFAPLAVACCFAKTILYKKKTPGDCPRPTSYSFGPGAVISKAGGIAATGASTVAGVAGLAGAAGVAGSAALVATGIGLAILPFTIWGMFSAHHAAAVQKEQASLCEIVMTVNVSWEQIDALAASGQISSAADILAALDQLKTQASNAIRNSGVFQDCNAACYIERFLFVVTDLRKALYKQSLAMPISSWQSGDTQATTPKVVPPPPSVAAVGTSLTQSNGIVGIALAALTAKLTGVL